MKLSNPLTRKWKWNFTVLSFAFPCVGMLVVMLISGYIPFGKTSMLYSDMYHQYYPFFLAFRRSLRQGQSLLYNWSIGMGVDYLGLISYYLASPLNLLSVLLPEKWYLQQKMLKKLLQSRCISQRLMVEMDRLLKKLKLLKRAI